MASHAGPVCTNLARVRTPPSQQIPPDGQIWYPRTRCRYRTLVHTGSFQFTGGRIEGDPQTVIEHLKSVQDVVIRMVGDPQTVIEHLKFMQDVVIRMVAPTPARQRPCRESKMVVAATVRKMRSVGGSGQSRSAGNGVLSHPYKGTHQRTAPALSRTYNSCLLVPN